MLSHMRSLRWPSLSATPNVPPVLTDRSLASLVSAARQTTETRTFDWTRDSSVSEIEPGSVDVRDESRRRTSRDECAGK